MSVSKSKRGTVRTRRPRPKLSPRSRLPKKMKPYSVFLVEGDAEASERITETVKTELDVTVHHREFAMEFYRDGSWRDSPCLLMCATSLTGLDGIALAKKLFQEDAGVPVCMMATTANQVLTILGSGADEFIAKPVTDDELLDAVVRGYNRIYGIDNDPDGRQHDSIQTGVGNLTVREVEVLGLLAEHRSPAEIANTLHIAPKTVEAHRARIIDKLQARSTGHLYRIIDVIHELSHEA